MTNIRPFHDIDLKRTLEAGTAKLKSKVDSFTNDEIMANNLELLADNLYEEFFIQPVTINEEDFSKRNISQQKVKNAIEPFFRDFYGKDYVEVDGVIMEFYFPFEGEKDLFKCQASTFSVSGYPNIEIEHGYIKLCYSKTLKDLENPEAQKQVMKKLDSDIKSIKSGIAYANSDVNSYNASLKSLALRLLTEKKKKVESFFTIASMFEVPVEKTDYSKKHIPLTRNISPISHNYDTQPLYCISESDYMDILETIKHTGSTYERTPSSYKSMKEEDLRNALLAALNATYKGSATGEAFRNNGKTDICIEKENRAAFVAECKMWTGQSEISEALSQLDSYLTWRDCKTALIYFVRRKDYLKILSTAEETLRSIPSIRQVKNIDKNQFRCTMISDCNPGQHIQVEVILFNMYCDK